MSTIPDFRAHASRWLAENAQRFAGYKATDPGAGEVSRALRTELWDAGLLGITLDPAYGGQGLTSQHEKAFAEEAAKCPPLPFRETVTTGICAPTLLDIGSEAQKRRHVARMIRGEEIWTQLLSEPGAGSDLAGLQTRAVRDGVEYVLNGQKVWTSGAMNADFALCVARTNHDVPKHQGLSMFIVDLRTPGVTIRPLRQMTGDSHFNEVFLDDARVAATDLVGGENDGWRALMIMLTHERLALGAGVGAGGSRQGWTRQASAHFIEMARHNGMSNDEVTRQELAKLYISERILSHLGQKMRDEIAAGIAVGSRGSLAKLATALISRQSANLGARIAGTRSQAWDPNDPFGADLATELCFSPMTAIAGGTNEIQRNTIAERVLGLPKEPQPDRDLPFRETLQNPSCRR
ncbi:MAG: acyl-CoA dehydrogenase family protein [Acidimicrobiales bacterium]